MRLRVEKFETASATYNVHISESEPGAPFGCYLHGGPGFNAHGERTLLGPLLHPHLNFIWFDMIGCGDSPARNAGEVTLGNQHRDVVSLLRKFAGNPVHVVTHCWGMQEAEELIRSDRDLVRSLVVYSPMDLLSDIFKRILRRGLQEGQLDRDSLSSEETGALEAVLACRDEDFSQTHVMAVLGLAVKMADFQRLYWSDVEAYRRYTGFLSEKPFRPDTFVKILAEYYSKPRPPRPSFSGIPTLFLRSDNDDVTPWKLHGERIVTGNPDILVKEIPGAFHWVHHQDPKACARHTIDFISGNA